MSDRIRCACSRCTIRSLMGPAIVITIGVLFLFSEMRGGFFDFGNTYPVILIVIGAVSLAAALAPMDGHITGAIPPAPPAGAPGPPPPPLAGQSQGQ
jgi:ABC-type spermidine/putrescine transport system permease subunit II